MSVEHSTLTGSDLHEPKGTAAANTGEVYIANGSGSGAWTAHHNRCVLTTRIDDISTASSAWVVTPVAGTISKIYSVTSGATTGGAAILTAEIAGVAVTNGVLTVAVSGSAAGIVDSATPSAANTVTAGAAIEITTDGGSTNTVSAVITFEITPS
jgi:hypothetical protein